MSMENNQAKSENNRHSSKYINISQTQSERESKGVEQMIKTPSDYNGPSKPESRFMIKRIPMPHTTMHNYYTNERPH